MIKPIIAVLGLFALAGCASAPAALPRASAVEETVRVEMDIHPHDNGLTWAQIDLIDSVAAEYKARGHGPLVISYPQGSLNAETAIDVIAEARTQLYQAGLDWRVIAGGAYNARGHSDAPVVFSFNRYQAVAPDCDMGWENLRNAHRDDAWKSFGCTSAANLAAMVADPRDLIAPRTMQAPDTGRRQTVTDAYRQGLSTASERSENESGAISSAIDN